MEKSKFAEIFNSLSGSERKEFGKFLESPFYNTNRNLSLAYELICENDTLPTKEEIHKHIYGDKEYKDENIRYILSELLKLSEEYLGVLNLRKHEHVIKLHTLTELNSRDLDKLFERNLKSCRKKIDEINPNDYSYHLADFEAISAERDFNSKRKEFITDQGGRTEAMIRFYAIEILKECRFFYNQNVRSLEKESGIPMEREVLDYVQKNNFLGVPAIEIIYYQVMTLLEYENTQHFYLLKKLSEKYAEVITHVEKYNAFVILLNYANKRIAFGDKEFIKERLEVHKMSDKVNALTKDNYIAPLRFERIVDDAIAVGDFIWAEEFIRNYGDYLPGNEKEDTISLSYSNINYVKGDKEKALEYILKVNFEPVVLNLRKRNITMKLYYELGYLETLISYMDSYKHYLAKNQKQMPPDVFEHYTNFVKAVADLTELKSLYDKDRVDKLMIRLEKLRPGKEKHWVTEMAGKLSKDRKD